MISVYCEKKKKEISKTYLDIFCQFKKERTKENKNW